jgi:hypothetical protein
VFFSGPLESVEGRPRGVMAPVRSRVGAGRAGPRGTPSLEEIGFFYKSVFNMVPYF